jgi:biotin operon repressor
MDYGQLGRKEEAKAALIKLLDLYPTIAQNYAREARKYNMSEAFIERAIEGLRKAGLEVPLEKK